MNNYQYLTSEKNLVKNQSNSVALILGKQEIKAGIEKIAKKISYDYRGQKVKLLVVREGACWFAEQLCAWLKFLNLDFMVDAVTIKTYSGIDSAGKIKFYNGQTKNLKDGRKIIVVEDLLDSGLTWLFLQGLLFADIIGNNKLKEEIIDGHCQLEQLLSELPKLRDNAASTTIDIVALFEKQGKRLPVLKKLPVRYTVFNVRGDLFLFGCGLDLRLSNYPFLKPELRQFIKNDFRDMDDLLGVVPEEYLADKDKSVIPLAIQEVLKLNKKRGGVNIEKKRQFAFI